MNATILTEALIFCTTRSRKALPWYAQVTWVAMIICILFFEMNLATALWTGLVVGIAYTMFARAMYRQQLALLQREMLREHQATLPQQRSPSGSSPRWLPTSAPLRCSCLRSLMCPGQKVEFHLNTVPVNVFAGRFGSLLLCCMASIYNFVA